MIQIDDAGSGSFIGGTCIGVYRPETNDYYYDIIPVELYNKENFKKKLYLDAVVEIVHTAFKNLGVTKNDTIEICRGYMFEHLKKWLENHGYYYYITHISGHFQQVIEKNFELYSVQLGLPPAYIQYTKYPFHFHKLLRWVFADHPSRLSVCKVGWKCWEKYQYTTPLLTHTTANIPNQFCLKCGALIALGSVVRKLTYISNKENYIYLHKVCNSIPDVRPCKE